MERKKILDQNVLGNLSNILIKKTGSLLKQCVYVTKKQ